MATWDEMTEGDGQKFRLLVETKLYKNRDKWATVAEGNTEYRSCQQEKKMFWKKRERPNGISPSHVLV